MGSAALRRELTAFRAAVLNPTGTARSPDGGGRLHGAFRDLAERERTSALADLALRLHVMPGTDGAMFWSREADGETFEQIFDRRSRTALARWDDDQRLQHLVEAAEMWVRARADAGP